MMAKVTGNARWIGHDLTMQLVGVHPGIDQYLVATMLSLGILAWYFLYIYQRNPTKYNIIHELININLVDIVRSNVPVDHDDVDHRCSGWQLVATIHGWLRWSRKPPKLKVRQKLSTFPIKSVQSRVHILRPWFYSEGFFILVQLTMMLIVCLFLLLNLAYAHRLHFSRLSYVLVTFDLVILMVALWFYVKTAFVMLFVDVFLLLACNFEFNYLNQRLAVINARRACFVVKDRQQINRRLAYYLSLWLRRHVVITNHVLRFNRDFTSDEITVYLLTTLPFSLLVTIYQLLGRFRSFDVEAFFTLSYLLYLSTNVIIVAATVPFSRALHFCAGYLIPFQGILTSGGQPGQQSQQIRRSKLRLMSYHEQMNSATKIGVYVASIGVISTRGVLNLALVYFAYVLVLVKFFQ